MCWKPTCIIRSPLIKVHAKSTGFYGSGTAAQFSGFGRTSSTALNDSFSSFNSTISSKSRIFHLRPRINVISLTDISYNLGQLIMEDPRKFRKYLQLVIFQISLELQCDEITNQSQIVVTPVIQG